MSFNEKTGLIDFDLDYITDIYEAAVKNKLDAYGLYKISVTSVKSERTNDIKKNLKSIEDAKGQLKKTKNESDRKRIERQIKNMNKKQKNIKESWYNLHKLENELLNQEEKETKSIYE
jgi:DNA-binding transcriptional regulator GbsR (MarR family)